MDDLVSEFKQLKKIIISLSEKKARLEGKKEQKLSELKEKYSIISIKAAESKLEELAAEIETMENELQGHVRELEDIVKVAVGSENESAEV